MKTAMMAALAVSTLLASSTAWAANTALILWNTADPLGAETATGTGSADLTASNLDGITVTLSFVSRTTSPNDLTEGNIQIVNTDSTVQTLKLIAGANGYAGPSDIFKLTGTIGATLGGSDLVGNFFADNTDTLNGQTEVVTGAGINAFNSGPLTGTDSFSFNGFGANISTTPYGLAEELTLTLQPGASVFVQGISMETVVPEPKTWAMLGIGFALMAVLGWKRSRTPRFAVEA